MKILSGPVWIEKKDLPNSLKWSAKKNVHKTESLLLFQILPVSCPLLSISELYMSHIKGISSNSRLISKLRIFSERIKMEPWIFKIFILWELITESLSLDGNLFCWNNNKMNSLLPKYIFNLEFSLVLGLINTKKTSGEKNTDRSKSAVVLSRPSTASQRNNNWVL